MAHKDVFEGTDLKIRVRLKEGSRNLNSAATLKLKVDSQPAGSFAMEVRSEWAEYKHHLDDVAADADNYHLEYEVTHAAEVYKGEHDYTVWPTWADITLTNDVTDAAVPDAVFKLLFDGDQSLSFRTDAQGKVRCKLKYKALIQGVASTQTMTFLRWAPGSEKGRDRTARVEVPECVAQLVSPQWKGQTIEQIVNRASANGGDTEGHDKQGRRIKFKLKLVDKKSPGKEIDPPDGTPIYVKVAMTDRTKRNADLADLEGVNDKVTTDTELSGKLSAVSKQASFTLVLGRGGLEKYKLQIGTTPACEDLTVKFTSMRKLWVGSVGRIACPDISKAVAAFLKVGIKVEKEDDTRLSNNDCGDALLTPENSGFSKAKFVVGQHNIATVSSNYLPQHAPHSAFLIWTDAQYDATNSRGVPHTKAIDATINSKHKISWPGEKNKVRGMKALILNEDDEGEIFKIALHDQGDTLRGVTATLSTTNEVRDLDSNHLQLQPKKSRVHVWIRVPDDWDDEVANGATVKVVGTAYFAKGPYLGWALNGGVVIALEGQGTSAYSSTIIHELGHRLRQTAGTPVGSTLTRGADHGWHYTGRGHDGGHCALGISRSLYLDVNKKLTDQNGSCVMYGESVMFTKYDFCAKCTPFVLAELVESI